MIKTKTAYTMAIKALTEQQKKYHPGHFEFLRSQGTFGWAETDHKKWIRLQQAKDILIAEMQRPEQEQQLGFGAVAGGDPE